MRYYSTIKELIDFTCNDFSDRDAFIFKKGDGYDRKTYQESQADCYTFAKNLVKKNYTKCNIGLLTKTSYLGLMALFGTILATDTAVVPDAKYSNNAIQDMFQRTDVPLILYDAENKEKAEELLASSDMVKEILPMEELLKKNESTDSTTLPEPEPERGAIILFTSGTTGVSKAVVLTNENICSNACAQAENFGADEVIESYGRTAIAILPIHHSLFLAFITTHMQEAEATYFNTNIAYLLDDLQKIKPVTLTVIPVIVEMIYNEVKHQSKKNPNVPVSKILRKITGGRLYGMACGSARLDPKFIREFWDWGIVISEGYGMTEASPTITNNNYKNFKAGSVGRAIPGVQVKIVDGEIWTKSKCVMKGYYKDTESTNEVMEDGWLKTGDLGYLDEEGFLYLTGRKKNLIILSNGENVSPEELEDLLSRENIFTEALTYEWNGTIAADLYIKDWEKYSVDALWSLAKKGIHNVNRQLPAYKKIQTFHIQKEPLKRNNMKKLVRSELGRGNYIDPPKKAERGPQSEAEIQIAEIFKRELNTETISVTDNFFEIGGNSLLARRVTNAIEVELNIKISLNKFFEHPSVDELAELVEILDTTEYSKIEQAASKDMYPMSALQKRMYFIYEAEPESIAYNIPVFYELFSMPDLKKLEEAVITLTNRHEIMRTLFLTVGGEYVQRVQENAVVDVSYEESTKSFREIADDFVKPFQLEAGPLMRLKIVSANGKFYLLFDIHHIISDGTSVYLLFKELSDLYLGKELEPVPMQYKDYSEWLRTDGVNLIDSQKDYWLSNYQEDAPILDMPTDYPRPQTRSSEGTSKQYRVDAILANRIQEYCLQTENTLFTVLFSSLMCVLSKYSRQEDVVIGSPVAGRTRQETEKMLGMFVNTLALREVPNKEKTYQEFLREVKEDYIHALDNQDYPFEDLVEALDINWDVTRNPLFDVMFTLQNEEIPDTNLGDIPMKYVHMESKGAQCDLSLEVRMDKEGFRFNWEYRSDLYKQTTIDILQEHLTVFLKAILFDDTQKLGDISILNEVEKENLLTSFHNARNVPMEYDTIVELLEERVKKMPDAVCAIYKEETLTYFKLNEKANQFANYLRKTGVKPDDRIAFIAEKSLNMLIGIYGILKSGAAYVPMDPAYPRERLQYMIDDCKPKAILVSFQEIENEDYHDARMLLHEMIDNSIIDIPIIDLEHTVLDKESKDNPLSVLSKENLAYVIYTSGTTGKPKGVLIEQKGLVNLSISFAKAYQMKTEDIVLQFASFCFDQSVSDIFSVLPVNAAISIIPEGERRDPERLVEYVNQTHVTILPLTPSYINLLSPEKMPEVRLLDAGGEAANLDVLKKWVKAGKEAMNSYGPTEVTVNSAYCYIKEDTTVLTIGRPVDNLRIFIMDGKNLCGVGVPGELCICGTGLARGYLNKEDITNEKFVLNPYGDERMYRTGDLARWLEDGTIDFLGRMDDQVKIRGYRIELGEIETVFRDIKEVKDAAVIIEKDTFGEPVILAYFVSERNLDFDYVRLCISGKLPHYMLPAAIMQIDKIPITSSGKLNKRALPSIEVKHDAGYVPPANKIESMICNAFCAVLNVDSIGAEDDFFEMGGHSLKATRVINLIEEQTDFRFTVKMIMTLRTPRKLAEELLKQTEQETYTPIPVAESKEYYKMSSQQKRIFFIHQVSEEETTYNMPFGIKLMGKVEPEKVKAALQALLNRHEILRTSFHLINGEPVQKIHDTVEADFSHEETDKTLNPEQILKSFVRPFDLEKAPLVRVKLVTKGWENYLFFDMHHIVSDGVSMNLISEEFNQIFSGEQLDAPKRQYKDYSEWMLTRDLSSQKEYWLNQFQDEIPVLNMPTDYRRPLEQSFLGSVTTLYTGKQLNQEIKTLAKKYGATEYMVFLSAFMVLLSKYSRQENIVVGTPISGRTHQDLETMPGMFVNTLAMRGKPEGTKTFSVFLEEMKKNCFQAYENQEYPFDELVEAVSIPRDLSRNPLFDVMFAMQNVENMASEFDSESAANFIEQVSTTSKFDLSFDVTEYSGDYLIEIEYCTDLYSLESARRIGEHFVSLLKQLVNGACEKEIGRIPMITREDEILLNKVSDTTVTYPKQTETMAQLFEKQAEQMPDAIAVMDKDKSLTYRELNEMANQLAHILRKQGVKPDDFVAIIAEKSVEMLVGIYGILKSGAAYVPMDVTYPKDRLEYMLADCQPKAMIWYVKDKENPDYKDAMHLKGAMDEKETQTSVPVIDLEQTALSEEPNTNLDCVKTGDNLAYVIYTSGTTGKPKGVLIEEKSLVNLSLAFSQAYGLTANDRILQFASFCFDQSVSDIFSAIPANAAVCMIPERYRREPEKLVEYVNDKKVTVLPLTPSYIKLLKPEDVPTMRLLDAGGEAADLNILKQWARNGKKVMNSYGPTEATVNAAYCYISEQTEHLTIGKPLANLQLYIADGKNLCGVGVPGELCIAGIGVSRGYLHMQELTSEKFVDNPFGVGKLYRTGDLAKWMPDGSIDFLGRIDSQIKIRGNRVELGEIEQLLRQTGNIKDCAVIVRKDANGEAAILAYYVADEVLESDTIKDFLSENLPGYMIPSGLLQIDTIPITTSGKLDQKALPDITVTQSENYKAPSTETQTLIASLFKEVLLKEKIGIYDNFFELGGHSIKATRLVNRLEERTGIRLAIRDIFKYPTIAKLAALMNKDSTEQYESIPQADKKDYYPMSSTQKRMFFIHQLDPNEISYNMPVGMQVEHTIHPDSVRKALQTMIERHEILRTDFILIDGEPVQKIRTNVKADFVYEDRSLNTSNADIGILFEEFVQPFDLAKAPLVRGKLVKFKTETYLFLDMHHIVSDGVSSQIFQEEFDMLLTGKTLPALTCQYKDYSEWMRARDLSAQKKYWQSQFKGEIPVLDMPCDFNRPQTKLEGGDVLTFQTGKALARNIKKLAKKHHATEYMVFLSAAMVLLGTYANQEDIVIGSPISARTHKDTETMLGMFVNTLAMRGQPSRNKTFHDFLEEMKETCLKAYENQEYPFEELVESVNVKRDLSRNPLFDVMLILQNTEDSKDIEAATEQMVLESEKVEAKFDITFDISEHNEQFEIAFEYATDLYEKESARRIGAHFVQVLQKVTENETTQIGKIDMMTDEDYAIYNLVNQNERIYEKDVTIYDLFERQVLQTPDKIVITCGEEQITYQELNKRSNRMAYRLRAAGVNRGDIIPLLADRNINLIAGLYGILKAGAAYLPLDPEYPEERIRYMLENAHADFALTEEKYHEKFATVPNVIRITDCMDETLPSENPNFAHSGNDLAYVLYTSGSTGKPKGVMIEHRQFLNFVHGMEEMTKIQTYESILCMATVSFDIFGMESHLPLIDNMQITMTKNQEDMDSDKIASLIEKNQIKVLQSTPSRLKLLMQGKAFRQALHSVRLICIGAEAFPDDLLQKLREYKNLRIFNVYGPTETTVWATAKEVTSPESKMTVGRPVDNAHFYIVNEDGMLLPPGIKGELLIGGAGVGRGYLNAKELTDKQYIIWKNGERVYHTGDVCCMLPDGDTKYVGRMDFQVKIRGYRIELGEIENTLLHINGIQDACVMAFGKTAEKELCAYYVLDEGVEDLDVSTLRTELGKTLAKYMIPSYFLRLDEMPLTPSGKVNRRALPAPDVQEKTSNAYVAPVTQMEQIMCRVFENVLGLKKSGCTDDFFELGGHSLKAVKLVNEVEEQTGIRISILDVFRNTTVASLAALVSELAGKSNETYEPIPKAEEKEYYPMSSMQKRIYLVCQMDLEATTYHIPFGIQLDNVFSSQNDAIEQSVRNEQFDRMKQKMHLALEQLLERHEILRTRFLMVDGELVQKIEANVAADIVYEKVDEFHPSKWMKEFVKPFDLKKAPLIRAKLIECNNKAYLLVDIHHIVGDGTSLDILVSDLLQLYQGIPLQMPTIQYKDYSEWMAKRDLTAQKDYWLKEFEDEIPVLSLPYDFKRPDVQSFAGGVVTVHTGKELGRKIQYLAKRYGATNYMVFLSAAMMLLGKYARQEDVVIGSPISGRTHKDTETMIGMFVNTLAMRGKPERKKKYADFLNEIKEICLKSYENQEYPFEELVDQVDVKRDLSRNPLFDVMLILHNEHSELVTDTENELNIENEEVSAKFDLTFEIQEASDDYELELEYCSDLFQRTSAIQILSHYVKLLEEITTNEQQTIGEVDLLTKEDMDYYQFANNTNKVFDLPQSLPELFLLQVKKTPDAIAVRCGEEEFTYEELNIRANKIANVLLKEGVTKAQIVPILAGREGNLLAGILGILKAGGAYLPLDPDYPDDRISYMIEHSQANVIVVQDALKDRVPAEMNTVLLSNAADENTSIEEPELQNEGSDLAYVIYTSGSTGKPKGVMIEHRQVVNFIKGMEVTGITNYSNILSLTTVSFDIFGLESYLPLVNGMTITLTKNRQALDAEAVAQLILQNHIEVIQTTPSRYKLLLQDEAFQNALKSVRLALVGGEAFPEDLLLQLRQFKNLNIYNVYGPTETTVWVSAKNVTDERDALTIGKPIANTHFYIVNEDGALLPPGVIGELAIGGQNVGRGYYRADELTKERFVMLSNGDRVYRTGDLARMLPDGETECYGRMDSQVKIRGYRVELGEIESAMQEIEGIKEAAVTAIGNTTEKELCGYYVLENRAETEKTGETAFDAAQIREQLRKSLALYMIPGYLVCLDEMPMTANGKMNRKALPKPTDLQEVKKTYEAPKNEMETLVCEAFEAVLNVGRTGRNDDFFELGGHSLKAVRLIRYLEEKTDVLLNIVDVFNRGSVAELALRLTKELADREERVYAAAVEEDENKLNEMGTPVEILTDTMHRLPLSYPTITSYNHHAHLLSILRNYDDTYDWIMSNYIQIFCHKDNIRHSFADFYFPMPNEVRAPELCPYILTQKINTDTLDTLSTDILEFVMNCIDRKTYVHLMINYYYVKQSPYYQKENFPHDVMISGYDKEKRVLYGSDFILSNTQRYTFGEIDFDAFVDGYETCKLTKFASYLKGQFFLYQLRDKTDIKYEFNTKRVIQALRNYYECKVPEYWSLYDFRNNADDRAFGLDVYDTLIQYILDVEEAEQDYIDFRMFYVLYDHKQLMNKRIAFLKAKDPKNAEAYTALGESYVRIEHRVQAVLYNVIQFDMANNIEAVKKNIVKLKEIRGMEEKALGEFFERYQE